MVAESPVRRYRIVVLGRDGEGVERPALRPLLVFDKNQVVLARTGSRILLAISLKYDDEWPTAGGSPASSTPPE